MRWLMIITLAVCCNAARGQQISGTWSGPFKTNGPDGTFDFTFAGRDANATGEVKLKFNGREATGKAEAIKLDGTKVTFTSDVTKSDVRFAANITTARLTGMFEVYENGRRTIVGSFCAAKPAAIPCGNADLPPIPNVATATQRADDSFDTSVAVPDYKSNGPKVLFDEAHKNFHKTTGNFKPFADLIRNDGYVITPNAEPFTADRLKPYAVLVISNARGEGNGSAFTDAEIEAVAGWLQKGGSLLLIADHTPFGGYSEKLANRLGIDMSKGYTDDPPHRDPVIKDLLFSRDNKLLGDHAITRGRNAAERINRLVSFTGQSLKSATGTPILLLGDTAYDEFPNSDKKISAAGRVQAIALKAGKGRAFVSGEAAMMTAQLSADDHKFGMNVLGIDNRQYALNIMHWLSGLLK